MGEEVRDHEEVRLREGGGKRERWIKHYSSCQRILLVGEGDFSFSACLARAFGTAQNMVATSFDYEDELPTKHWSSTAHLAELMERGCTVVHGIDVYDMDEDVVLKRMTKFDRVVYNFPHAGHDSLYCERHAELIRRHKELLKAFFSSAKFMISEGGEVHVSHRDDFPYCEWKLQEIAEKEGFQIKERVEFKKGDYPGYHNKRGGGIRSNKTFPLKNCFTFKFILKEGKEDCDLQITPRSGEEHVATAMASKLAI